MNKLPKHNSQPMSLLSAYLSSGAEMPKGITTRRGSLRQESSEQHPHRRHFPVGEPLKEEPPESLHCDCSKSAAQRIPGAKPLTSFGTRRASTLMPPHDLVASPLTSCSYQTLSKEYDMDTWRMYERIQSARTHSDEDLLNLVRQTVETIKYDSTGDDDTQEMDFKHNGSTPVPESEDIFEIEL